MSDGTLQNESATIVIRHPNWGAIWAGVFTFFAIWCVFGLLGMSIFANRLVGIGNSRDGLIHGMIMFGLSVMVALTVTLLAGNGIPLAFTNATGVHSPYLLGVFADLGWFGFVSLFLGWLAAMGGAVAGTNAFGSSVPLVGHAHSH
jgi:hypothetical protein